MSTIEKLQPASSSPLPDKKRLFFALWPSDQERQEIKQHAIKHFRHCQGRLLGKDNWHITLAYFGSADSDTQICLEQHAEKIISQPFELALSVCGFWPRPKVAWLAPAEIPEVLKQLTSDLQQEITACGYQPETRDYQPHMTLVRKAKYPPATVTIAPIKLEASSFCLVESITAAEGADYTVIKNWDL